MLPIVVQVRDRSLARVGVLADEDLTDFNLFPAKNDVGAWTLRLPHLVRDESGKWVRHKLGAALATPGAGIIVALPGGRRFSGPMLTPTHDATTDDPGGTWTFEGASDLLVLADRAAFPNPTIADAQLSSQSAAYDVRTGKAETIMRAFVSANIGPTAPTERRDPRITLAPDLGRGSTRTKSARFASLLELCQALAVTDDLLFDLVQVGSSLEFQVSTPEDLTGTVRMDIDSDTLSSTKFSYSSPEATRVIVLGQGEAAERVIRTRTSTASDVAAAEWGRVIERVVDQRQTADPDELDAAGDEILVTDGTEITSVDVTPSDYNARTLGLRWWVGDRVTVNVAGVPVEATISRVRVSVSADGIYAGATVGDPVGFDPDRVAASRASAVEDRVSALERNVGSGGSGEEIIEALPAGVIVEWGSATAPPNWLLCEGQAVSRATYASLFAAIGTTYGAGNGSTTFNLPDFRGRVPVGRDASQSEFDVLGESGGAKTHTLTVAEMPSHTHLDITGFGVSVPNGSYYGVASHDSAGQTGATGGNGPHNNLQPYRVVSFIIKASAGETPGDSALTTRVGALEAKLALTSGAALPVFYAKPDVFVSKSGTATTTKMPFATVEVNQGGHYSGTLSRFTAPVPGLYEFTVSLVQSTSVTGPIAYLYKNGAPLPNAEVVIAYGQFVLATGTRIVQLAAGDYVEVYLTNANNTAITVGGWGTAFSGKLLAAL